MISLRFFLCSISATGGADSERGSPTEEQPGTGVGNGEFSLPF